MCCSFADFELHVSSEDRQNVLEIYGPDGTEEVFRTAFVDRLSEEYGTERVV